jgi:hypothetical protein
VASPTEPIEADREPVAVDPPTAEAKRLWGRLGKLAVAFGADGGWSLIGGLMVQLHAYEHGDESRPTTDIDILGDARNRPSMTEKLAQTLKDLGGDLHLPPRTDAKIGYRFEIEGEMVEVLGPDGLREYPRTLGTFETIMVDGGTQALRRTERVPVSIAGAEPVIVRRPTLLGAILIKARAMASAKAKLAEHREDLIRLLTFVQDPRALADAGALSRSEQGWLRAIESDLAFDDPRLRELFSDTQLQRASQALALLSRRR